METSNAEQDAGKTQTHQVIEYNGGNMQNEDQKDEEIMEVQSQESCATEKIECNIQKQQKELENIQIQQDEQVRPLGNESDEQNKLKDLKETVINCEETPKEGKCLLQSNVCQEEHNKDNNQTKASSKEQPEKKQNMKQQQQQQQQQQQPKKGKDSVSENQERINYLVQASKLLVIMPPIQKTELSETYECADQALASHTGALATAIGRRCVMRLSPALKRSLCKGCGVTLVYGVNARVRHRSKRQKHLVVTCLACHTIKRFVNDKKYKLWCEQEEAILP